MLVEAYSTPVLFIAAAGCATIALLGSLGNLLAIVSLLRCPKLRRPSTYYIVNLSVTNLPVCVFAMPLMTVCIVQAIMYDTVYVSHTLIRWFALMGFVCNQAELHTICILGFNRVLAMYCPRLYQRMAQHHCYRYVLAGLWLYSLALWLPLAFGWLAELEVSVKDLFVVISRDSKVMRRLYLFLAFTLPLLVAIICHVMLLVKGLGLGAHTDPASQQQWRNHVTRTVSLVFLVLVMLSVPHIVVHAVHEREHSVPRAWLLVHVLFFARYVLDPAIFVLSSTEYRQAYMETLEFLCPPLVTSIPSSDTPAFGAQAPPCTPAPYARHKIIDLSAQDLIRIQLRAGENSGLLGRLGGKKGGK